jgi:hypothetical protein
MIKICTTLDDGTEICTTVSTEADAASRAYSTTVGNGVDTVFTLTHGLDALDLVPVVRTVASGDLTDSAPVITAVDADTATVTFPTPPTPGQFQVTLLAVIPAA